MLQLGLDHSEVARSLNNLGQILFCTQGQLSEVLALYQRALTIQERALSPDHLDAAESLCNLASDYGNQGKYSPAPTHIRAYTGASRFYAVENVPRTANEYATRCHNR